MTEKYYNSEQTAAALNCKPRSLYRLKGIGQVRTQLRVIGKQVHKFYHIGDVQKLIELRQSEEFHRKARENRIKAAHASNQARKAKKAPSASQERVWGQGSTSAPVPKLVPAEINGRAVLIAEPVHEVPKPWRWSKSL